MAHRFRVTLVFFVDLLRDLAGTARQRLLRWWRRTVRGEAALTVGVDIFPFFERMTGVGWYEWNLLARLPGVDAGIELNLYAHTFAAPGEPSPPPLPTGERTRFRFHHVPDGFLLPVGPTIAALRALIEPLLLFLDGNDVFFAPNFFVPRRHLPAGGRLVATVHDLTFLRLPEAVQRETLENLYRHLPGTLFAASRLIAVSQATADDLVSLAGVSRQRIHVIHEGVDPAFALDDGKAPAGLPPRYLLFVSTLEPRKNVDGLLDAFALAARAGYPGDLVLVGRWGWRTGALQRRLATSEVRARIHHLDYLDRPALAAVMRGAEAMVFPSFLEGFGLPVVEAMACGVPVIVSDRSSLPEVAGDAALYVDPDEPATIAEAMLRVGRDEALRERLRRAGRGRAALFRWDDAALATAAVFRLAAGLEAGGDDAYRV